MSKIKFDIQSMKLMTLFESITRSHVKDMIIKEESLIFFVMPGEIGKAIGKKAVNIKTLERISKDLLLLYLNHPSLFTKVSLFTIYI